MVGNFINYQKELIYKKHIRTLKIFVNIRIYKIN
jgi:hypothetical protein